MKERRQRSRSIHPERLDPTIPDGEQIVLLSLFRSYKLPVEEINFAIFGVLPPRMNKFWQLHGHMGVHKCLKAIISYAFPTFINEFKKGEILEHLDTVAHEALFHSILKFMHDSVGKGLETHNPKSIRKQLSRAWDQIEYLSGKADTNYIPHNLTQFQKVLLAYRNATPELKRAVELIVLKENPIAFSHKEVMKNFVKKILL